jgi:glycine cleavage system regulatory protein
MNAEKMVITLITPDRPGVVQTLSDTILEHEGNWLESRLSRLCGQFAGIIHIAISADKKVELIDGLNVLSEQGIEITFHSGVSLEPDASSGVSLELIVEANDRPGIVEEISSAIAAVGVNVDQMQTHCESASMAGYQMFVAKLRVTLPEGFESVQLENALEDVSDDLIVTMEIDS